MCRAIRHRFACGHTDTEHQVCEKVHEKQKMWAKKQAKKKEKREGSGWCCGLGEAGDSSSPPPEPCRSPQTSDFFRGSQVCRNCDRRRRPLPPNPPPSATRRRKAGEARRDVRREDSYIDPEHARWVVQNTPPESWPGCIPRPAPAPQTPGSCGRDGGVARVPRDARVAGRSGPRRAGGGETGSRSSGKGKGKGREVARPDMSGKSFFWDD